MTMEQGRCEAPHSLKLKATDQAAEFDKLGGRTCWFKRL